MKLSKIKNYGLFSSILGVIANLFLFVIKLVVGILMHSIAITADAINNLSDTGSSITCIIAYKASTKPPDKKHPFGHARIEYILSIIIGISIISIAIQIFKVSIDNIINRKETIYNLATFIVLFISIIAKLFISIFNFKLYKISKSLPLKAVGIDSLTDIISTSVILVASTISHYTKINLDGYAGILVSFIILIAGIKIIIDSLSPLLGETPHYDLVDKISSTMSKYEGILGTHDLIVHNYGPNRNFASIHAEVDSKIDIMQSHDLIDNIEKEFKKDNINLVIHLDPILVDNAFADQLKQQTMQILNNIDENLSFHDFRIVLGISHCNIHFDLVIPHYFNQDISELKNNINTQLQKIDNKYVATIHIDKNYVG